MNFDKIKVGMEIKNYKELCELIEEPTLTGDSKKSHLKEIDRYIQFHKNGIKFIIDNIYNKPKEKQINERNNLKYIDIIELLILDTLAKSQDNNGTIFLSKNQLLKELQMINENYSFCHYPEIRLNKLSKYTKIEKETIEDFYESADSTLKRNLEKALDNLKKQFLILWSNEITVCEMNIDGYNKNTNKFNNVEKIITYDEYDEELTDYELHYNKKFKSREATDEEKKFIIRVERDIMKELECNNKQELIQYGKWQLFTEQVDYILLQELNITRHYNSYKILFNKDHILEEYIDVLSYILKDSERNNNQNLLNIEITKRLLTNAKKRYNKSLKEKENIIGNLKNKSDTYIRRSNDKYIENNKKLLDLLINNKTSDIRNTIKRTKI